jgi:Zn-dependent M16 (insulinase) family peptidase
MSASDDQRNPGLLPGGRCGGYTVKRVVEIPESGFSFYQLEHERTGARHIHISNDDNENAFGVAFKTVPKDSTGVAHILEHTVLCGSDKFPVRDPFFSMLKRSLSTFMNALTASDWTMYPFSTQNRKDYENLMDVYLDAAFFPKIEELSFKQEGHRLEIAGDRSGENQAPQLLYKGVVYNEMKGAMSSPDQVMARSLLKALYPSTTYSNNSGGDPDLIPTLTYAQLKDFHQHHYHPSNAYFYTYGNFPLQHHLALIEEKVLGKFDRIHPDTDVPPQPRWSDPREALAHYPLAAGEDPLRKCQACVAWLTADIREGFEVLVLAILEQILMGNPGSPLKKALIDSQLGSALCDAAGFESDNRDTMFVAGLKDIEESAAATIESMIFDVLKRLVSGGIDQTLIESAIHQIEFHHKEVTNTPYPYGIKNLLMIVGTWLHGGDPLDRLRVDKDLTRIRSELDRRGFFEGRIQKYFLENPHRVLFKLLPDPALEKDKEKRIAKELSQAAVRLSESDIAKIEADAKALKERQETQEDVSGLPTLTRADIPPDVPRVRETATDERIPVNTYDQRTSGVFYLVAAAGLGRLDGQLIPLVPFFCYALPKVGTRRRDYTEMAKQIDLYTGGVGLSANARNSFDGNGNCIPFIAFNAKCLNRNQGNMFAIVEELVFETDFSDVNRLKSILMEYRAGLESMVVRNGHRLAISLAARNFSETRHLNEIWSGVFQLQTIKELLESSTGAVFEELAGNLAAIRRAVFIAGNLKVALVGEERAAAAGFKATETIYGRLPSSSAGPAAGDGGFGPPALEIPTDTIREGWSTSSAVSFVAQIFETVRMAHADAPALAVIAKLLRSLYLHREIREKGGAYGGFSLYNPEDGLFCFASYRDPHIVSTLKVFENAASFVRSGAYKESDIDEAVLQVCSEIDKPDPPGPGARKAFYRRMIGLSDEARQRYKQALLQLNRQQVLDAAEKYFGSGRSTHAVAVISGESQLQKANAQLERPLAMHRI